MTEVKPPIIVRRYEEIDVKAAMTLTGWSDRTIRRAFKQHRLGAKADRNSPLRISEPALVMLKHGDHDALELLRAGEREHPAVARYFRELGYLWVAGKRTKVEEPAPPPEWKRRKDMTLAELRELEAAS